MTDSNKSFCKHQHIPNIPSHTNIHSLIHLQRLLYAERCFLNFFSVAFYIFFTIFLHFSPLFFYYLV